MGMKIGGKTFPTESELEEKIRRAKLSPEDAQATRIDYDNRVFEARRADAREKHPGLAKLSPAVGFGLNYGETAGAGLASTVASVVGAPFTAARRDVGLGDAIELNKAHANRILGANPTAATAGTVAAAVSPGRLMTPVNAAGRIGYQLLGGGALAKRAAASSSLASVAAKQIAGAFVGGAGSVAAIELAKTPGDLLTRERDLGEIMADTVEAATSPTNIGLSLGLGSVASLPRFASDPAVRDLANRAAVLLPGFKAVPDMMRDSQGFLAGLVDALAKTSVGRRVAVDWMNTNFYEPMRAATDSLRIRYGIGGVGTAAARTAGAEAVRGLVPTVENPIGALGSRRAGIGSQIGRGTETVGTGPMYGLVRVLNNMAHRHRDQWGSAGGNSSEFASMKQQIRNAATRVHSGEEAPIAVLENWRQRLAMLAGFEQSLAGGSTGMSAVVNPRDVREAKVLYRAVRETMRQSSPRIDQALRDIHSLRSAERSLSQIANTANLRTDQELVQAAFTAPNFRRRWATIQQHLPADRVQALRGAYLAEFLQDVSIERGFAANPQEALNVRVMNRSWSGRGSAAYRQEVFDAVLPGLRRELRDMGEVSDWVLRSGIGRAEGSQTAPREEQMALVNASTDAVGMGVGVLRDPGATNRMLSVLLGAAGKLGLAKTLISGRLASYLNAMAFGVQANPNQVALQAVFQGGGPVNVAQALATLVGRGAGAAVSGVREIGSARNQILGGSAPQEEER